MSGWNRIFTIRLEGYMPSLDNEAEFEKIGVVEHMDVKNMLDEHLYYEMSQVAHAKLKGAVGERLRKLEMHKSIRNI